MSLYSVVREAGDLWRNLNEGTERAGTNRRHWSEMCASRRRKWEEYKGPRAEEALGNGAAVCVPGGEGGRRRAWTLEEVGPEIPRRFSFSVSQRVPGF